MTMIFTCLSCGAAYKDPAALWLCAEKHLADAEANIARWPTIWQRERKA